MLLFLSRVFKMERKDSIARSSKLPSKTSSKINKLQFKEFFNCATDLHANNKSLLDLQAMSINLLSYFRNDLVAHRSSNPHIWVINPSPAGRKRYSQHI